MLLNPTKISARHLNGTNARKAFRAATPSNCGSRRSSSAKAVAGPAVAPAAAPAAEVASLDYNQLVREGHYEAPLVQEQVCGCADAAAVASVCVQSDLGQMLAMPTACPWCSGDPLSVVHTVVLPGLKSTLKIAMSSLFIWLLCCS